MSEYDFILDNMRYSYSSVNSFLTCPFCFRLTYIDHEERTGNSFSDFGNLIHKIMEEFFKGTIEKDQMLSYYIAHWNEYVVNEFPQSPPGMKQNYYNAGIEFFKKFKFDKEAYDILFIEGEVRSVYHDIQLVVKPDLILREKSTGKCILVDYKTARMKSTKKDKEKQLEEYMRQMELYVYWLWSEKDVEVKEIQIWFIRDAIRKIINVDPLHVADTVFWFEDTVSKIKQEVDWNPKEKRDYFCDQICSVRSLGRCGM